MKNISKRLFIITLLSLGLFIGNVYACGEIKNLKVGDGTIKVVGNNTYLVTLKEGTSKVKIDASTDYDWVEGYGPREVSTNSDVELLVDGNKCGFGIYTHTISFNFASNLIAENTPDTTTNANSEQTTNESETSTNAVELLDIKIDGIDFEFESDKHSYDFEVDSDVNSLNIETTKVNESDTVTVSSNANALEDGRNIVTVTVKSTEGTESVYTFNITKEKAKSNNNYLSSLKVAGYTLNFDPSTTSYDLVIGNEKELNITATTESKNAEYKVNNNKNLENGSVVTITVTAEDGTTQDYVINIIKKFNIMDYWIYLLIAGLILLIILILIITQSKKKKRKKVLTPETVEAQAQTAGVVGAQVIPSNEVAPQQTQVTPPQNANSTLQIITPTNIETQSTNTQPVDNTNIPSTPQVQQTDDTQGQTEVFKL